MPWAVRALLGFADLWRRTSLVMGLWGSRRRSRWVVSSLLPRAALACGGGCSGLPPAPLEAVFSRCDVVVVLVEPEPSLPSHGEEKRCGSCCPL